MEHFSMESILELIHQAATFERLRELRDKIHEELGEGLLFPYDLEWNEKLNTAHDALIQRVVYLSEKETERNGIGAPPVPYAFVLFGSGGRKEQTLWSDQDNGIIYAEPPAAKASETDEYFKLLSGCIEMGMSIVGYPPCSGNVISTNARWRQTLPQYCSMLLEWLQEPEWENVRYLLIVADMRCVYGDVTLADALIDQLYDYRQKHPEILFHMLQNTLHHKISLGVFGQLIKERYGEDAGGVDIKYGAYIPIVNGVRLLALEAGICSSSTRERIERLISGGFVEDELGHDWLDALALVLKLRSETPYQMEQGQYTTRGKLPADMLTKERTNELKFCLRIGKDLQKYVQSKIKERG
ncbi:DUF294 nucleotidyltransferase-like domain-containing protein [Paenibacillus thalictri]|uniref:Signal transduction protein n=1 Tax=Paenibacillus thalictri TaxID=2527873 RepID=A0A4Q9E183_9BACL|nr:DUF294 nucleotidyltransferase-like domain-containing protein [Paenibacillus thalictri]TBL81321.1 hypothetical protein EYB31_04350 [Paenibacillus thalictri]